MFPRRAVASVVGISGMVGVLSNMLGQAVNGGNYTPIFALCEVAYLAALAVVHLMIPRLSPANVAASNRAQP